jgi:hypothetical protein
MQDHARLIKIRNTHFNILLQSIEHVPAEKYVNILKKMGKVTCTTAHEKYSTLEIREKLGVPLHKLSTFVSPEKYAKTEYSMKENLMIVSPDVHPEKTGILRMIAERFPQIRIQLIKNMTYEEYKRVISRAKWALTFGEGLDGYFVETAFSGGISFSVYNPRFFTEDFRSLRTVYDNYDVLKERICNDIKYLDDKTVYAAYQKEQHELCHRYYRYEEYIKNIELFYREKYTFG